MMIKEDQGEGEADRMVRAFAGVDAQSHVARGDDSSGVWGSPLWEPEACFSSVWWCIDERRSVIKLHN